MVVMFERFTDSARRALTLAQEEAHRYKCNHIGTEHILLALIAQGKGPAYSVLIDLGLDTEAMRRDVLEGPWMGPGPEVGFIPYTTSAKKVLELSLREALQLGHSYIGTEHLLLGLIRVGEGATLKALDKANITTDEVRRAVIAQLKQDHEQRVIDPWLDGIDLLSTALDHFTGLSAPICEQLRKVKAEAERQAGDAAVKDATSTRSFAKAFRDARVGAAK